MMLKKKRERRQLSQEHLATISGLSVRTIQRIERGDRASIESLKSLASALETSVQALDKEVFMLDKSTNKWRKLPILFRLNFIGSDVAWLALSRRDQWLKGEMQTAIFGLGLLPFGFFEQGFIVGGLLMICIAYLFSLIIRMADENAIW